MIFVQISESDSAVYGTTNAVDGTTLFELYSPRREPCGHALDNGAKSVYGTTSAVYGTTNADAGVGIGMKRGDSEIWQKTAIELADKAMN